MRSATLSKSSSIMLKLIIYSIVLFLLQFYVECAQYKDAAIVGTILDDLQCPDAFCTRFSENECSGKLPNVTQLQPKGYVIQCVNGEATQLYVSTPEATGSLSPLLGQLTMLTRLDISTTLITGTIPTEIGRLTLLTFLALHVNTMLGGALPSELGQLSLLTALHIGNSKITGTIPTSFSNFKKLVYLSLDKNSLTGSVPPLEAKICQLAQSAVDTNCFVRLN
jgi:hypothetical protein